MAKATDFEPGSAGERTGGGGSLSTGDRARRIKQARRGSSAVRTLRWTLPLAGLVIVGGYAIIVLRQAGVGSELPALAMRQILPTDLTMDNPRYEGFNKDGGSYTFTAKTAQQDLTAPTNIKLNAISGTIFDADKTRTDVTAVRGVYDNKKSVLDLFEEIDVRSDSGLKAKLKSATILTKQNLLFSKEPVSVEFPSGTVLASEMTLDQKARTVAFMGAVETHLKPENDNAATTAAPATPGKGTQGFFTPTNEPIDILSERLDINDATKVSIFSGNITATQGDAKLTTPELEVSYEGDAANQSGQKPPPGAAAGKIRRIVAKQPVVITRGEADRVTSDTADFDAINETAVLMGNVVLTSGTDRRATGDRADLDQRADTALLTGETVVVVQGQNELTGRRLFLDRKAGRTQLTSPPGGGKGPGRVTAHLIRSAEKAAGAAAKAAASAVAAAGAGNALGMASFKTDPNAPVNVEADQLDVIDATKVAIFRGNVTAAQGDFEIKSSELNAFYSGDVSLANMGQTEPGAKPAGSAQITRIEAKKNVVVTSKDGQKANGDWAIFDAKTNLVTVGGDVVLTENENVVRGSRLVIDMTTGQSTIDSAPAKTTAQPAGGGWVTEAPDEPAAAAAASNTGRASAIFFPQQLKDAKNGKNSDKGGAKVAPDGWQSRTDPGTLRPGAN